MADWMRLPISYDYEVYLAPEVRAVLPSVVIVPRGIESARLGALLLALVNYVDSVGRAWGVKIEAAIEGQACQSETERLLAEAERELETEYRTKGVNGGD